MSRRDGDTPKRHQEELHEERFDGGIGSEQEEFDCECHLNFMQHAMLRSDDARHELRRWHPLKLPGLQLRAHAGRPRHFPDVMWHRKQWHRRRSYCS